ncbi:MAG: helicase SNF2, partial [Candidatus Eremiobacteraeota bacterium]|nr:helicase SNF2 [Candidatus Eremiobacteraeota bacterium]
MRWDVPSRIREVGDRLRTFAGVERVQVPESFRGKLRPYQRDGLDWLQFLSSFGFGGILADDMGLGKSVQTLAHLLCEKEAGRLTQPVLLVVPTSIVYNWCDEAARFAPTLRVLSLHGPARSQRF